MPLTDTRIWKAGVAVLLLLWVGGWNPAISQARQAQPRRTLTRQTEREEFFRWAGGRFLPLWSGRALLGAYGDQSDEPIIWGIDRDGNQERIRFSIPDGRYIRIYGVAGAQDGSIAVIGSAYSNDSRAGCFLARIAPDRSQKIITRVWPYVPEAVTIGPDGVTWTVGWVPPDEDRGVAAQYNVLKRFDSSGKLLSTSVVRAKGSDDRGREAANNSLLRSSRDRVGWLTNANDYIEFSLDGHELARFAGPPERKYDWLETSVALSEENDVVLGTAGGDRLDLWSLDRDKGIWNPIEVSGRKLPVRLFCLASMEKVLSSTTCYAPQGG